jgi:hypothetical protein
VTGYSPRPLRPAPRRLSGCAKSKLAVVTGANASGSRLESTLSPKRTSVQVSSDRRPHADVQFAPSKGLIGGSCWGTGRPRSNHMPQRDRLAVVRKGAEEAHLEQGFFGVLKWPGGRDIFYGNAYRVQVRWRCVVAGVCGGAKSVGSATVPEARQVPHARRTLSDAQLYLPGNHRPLPQ